MVWIGYPAALRWRRAAALEAKPLIIMVEPFVFLSLEAPAVARSLGLQPGLGDLVQVFMMMMISFQGG